MKKSLRPQIVAPVQRQTPATSSLATPAVAPSMHSPFPGDIGYPFAGDDAE